MVFQKLFSSEDIVKIEIETLTDEAINTSLIEGEILKERVFILLLKTR